MFAFLCFGIGNLDAILKFDVKVLVQMWFFGDDICLGVTAAFVIVAFIAA